MPLVKYTTRLRTPRLRIIITHTLHVPDIASGSSSQQSKPDPAKSRIYTIQRPKGIDIFPYSSQLSFLISGSVDGRIAAVDEVCASGVGRHLIRCMRRNATFLGIQNISDIYVEDGIPQISCTSSHPLPSSPNPSTLKFVSLKLVYVWTTTASSGDGIQDEVTASTSQTAENPITSPCIIPFRKILDQVVHRLFSHHILPHYPLIFGPYAHSIRAEQALFPIVAKSLCSVIKRSKSKLLKHQALTSIEKLRFQNADRERASRRILRKVNPLAEPKDDEEEGEEEDEEEETVNALDEFTDIIGRGLTNMFKRRIKPWNKGLHIHANENVDKDLAVVSSAPYNMDGPPQMTTWGVSDTAEFSLIEDEDLWMEEPGDSSNQDWNSRDRAEANVEEDAFSLDIQDDDSDMFLEPYFASSVLSDSDPVDGVQLTLKSAVPYEKEECQGLDSEDEFMDIFVDESHDLVQVYSSLQSHAPSLPKKRADSLQLLSGPAHRIDRLSDRHAVTLLNGQDPEESLGSCMDDKYSNGFVSVVGVSLGLDGVDSDMEVLEFDFQAAVKENTDDFFGVSRTRDLDLLSQVSYQQRYDLTVCSRPHRDGQSLASRRMDQELDLDDLDWDDVDVSPSSFSSSQDKR